MKREARPKSSQTGQKLKKESVLPPQLGEQMDDLAKLQINHECERLIALFYHYKDNGGEV